MASTLRVNKVYCKSEIFIFFRKKEVGSLYHITSYIHGLDVLFYNVHVLGINIHVLIYIKSKQN